MSAILAKTDGTTLKAHTRHVVEQARAWLDAFPFLETKYRKQTGDELRPQLLEAADLHDEGKRHPKWQVPCQKAYEEYKRTGSAGTHLRDAGLRHEFDSLRRAAERSDIDLTLPQKAAIAAHHGKLGFDHKDRWMNDDERFAPLWASFYEEATRWEDPLTRPPNLTEKALNERFRIAGVRSLLRLADTRASIQEKDAENWVPDPEDLQFAYEFPYRNEDGSPSCRGVQRVVMDAVEDPDCDDTTMILRAPTGSGKTDASLLWAKHQIQRRGRADRCVIAMPTRFTSNSLSVDVDENVSRTGLYHSSAWHARYADEAEGSDEARHRAQKMHRMARLLTTPVSVCTIDHLCAALAGAREDHFTIFYHLCNSCVVIDEADFYDPFVQANLNELLGVLRHFDVPVLVMSATVPDAATDFYDIGTLEEDTSDLDRTRCVIEDAGSADTPDDIAEVLRGIAESDPPAGIVYANTVSRALAYYDWFRENTGVTPILYHSRFTEPDKKDVEERLLDALGQEAWETGTAGGVAILTQIGEMSLNISAPVMVSELCPYDRLAQRAGRLGRFEGMDVGTLHVVTPTKDGALYPAPYGEFDQEEYEWHPGRALVQTRNNLDFEPHSAQDFIDAVDTLYPNAESFAPSDDRIQSNRKRLKEHLQDDWLIVSARQSDEETGATDDWKSRDIPPQATVLTVCPDQFNSYAEYRAFEQEYGVTVPMYHVQRDDRDQRPDLPPVRKVAVKITDRKSEEAWYSPVYSETEGLILDEKRERSVEDRCL
jgi:CRISPR-associated endonuclease/helicase Cas3